MAATTRTPTSAHLPNLGCPDQFIPRRYQEEVFTRAQKENIIAALDTGSGKTLISLMLIRWISTLESSRDKAIIFLVPKVVLVEQQGNFLAKHTPLGVLKLCGDVEIDPADRSGWEKRFSKHDIFVMTPQILLNLLTHSLWSIDKVSLMVFDECHHTRKNHPYNGIMREYFHVTPACRPKIFGMTASPIWDPRDPVRSLASLEADLDSKIVGVRTNVAELALHSPKPTEVIKIFPPPLAEYDFPAPSIWTCLKVFETQVWDELGIPWSRLEMRYQTTLDNLGPYGASLYLHSELQPYLTRTYLEYLESARLIGCDTDVGLCSSFKPKIVPEDFWHIRDIHIAFNDYYPNLSSTHELSEPVPITWCSPKVQSLVQVLLAYHTPTFQGIIFVEQRQIAACLSAILPALPCLNGLFRTACLVGQGVGAEGVEKITPGARLDAVALFRKREINLLIATSVAEEGLDFPACDLIVRFNTIQHMVGYVQSRGRARTNEATFVVMVQNDDIAELSRYQALKTEETQMHHLYRTRHSPRADESDGMDKIDDEVEWADPTERERYVVAATGAVLSYDNSIHLLHHLCSLIPCDPYTPVQRPIFSDDFECTLQLPSSIPVASEDAIFHGPARRSKKEAKRAVAFMAVKRLHQLNVFDQYLLPCGAYRLLDSEFIDGKVVRNANEVPVVMEVQVADPWTTAFKLWMHILSVDKRPVAALITGSNLPTIEKMFSSRRVHLGPGHQMSVDEDDGRKKNIMRAFTERAIWYRITTKPLSHPPALFLVPLTQDNLPDFEAMEDLVSHPWGHLDWTGITEKDYDTLMIMNINYIGRPLLLRNIRYDLSMTSAPLPGSREENAATYYEYFQQVWTRKKWDARVPNDGPLLEALHLPHCMDNISFPTAETDVASVPNGWLLPLGNCKWIPMSQDIRTAYELLVPLCFHITDIYRARRARFAFGLPPIHDDLLAEALILPCANAGLDNQRLETLGDAVLELCTSVHLFNEYPHWHEGQLTKFRQGAISNHYLLARAKEVGLEGFLTSEVRKVRKWSFTEPEEKSTDLDARRTVTRKFPRRSLQDCMEAMLGASFLTGGISTALHAGTALGLKFGGSIPWNLRYEIVRDSAVSGLPSLFTELGEHLGYTFRQSSLLVEAVTHTSFACSSSTRSYQRLEFLGDALLDLVVIKYLYDKFPTATSHQLALPRTKAVCAAALAYLAAKKLQLHKIMLVSQVELVEAVATYVPLLQAASGEDIIKQGWKYDPPKPLSDVFESVMAAVLIDSGYDYERTAAVVEHVMEEILEHLSPSVRRDPVSDLVTWMASQGCNKVIFEKRQSLRNGQMREGIASLVHGVVIAGPIVAVSLSVARFVAAEKALAVLNDPTAENSLLKLCDCRCAMETDSRAVDGLEWEELELAEVSEVAEMLLGIDLVE